MTKNIIFDFDGTLADTLRLALAFGNENQRRFSMSAITRERFPERHIKKLVFWFKDLQAGAILAKPPNDSRI